MRSASLVRFTTGLLIVLLSITSGCDPDLSDDPIPFLAFPDVTINLTLPAYSGLSTTGGYATNDEAGVRGVIIYRESSSSFRVFERNCSYHPNDACATVNVDVSGLFMFEPCCSSTFSFSSGQPTGGIAWRPLRQYKVILDSNFLIITDEILE